MNFNLKEAIEILEKTPHVLENLLIGISDGWLYSHEGEGTWNALQVIDHLIDGEKTNWIPRLQLILDDNNKPFPPFDRFAHLHQESSSSPIEKLSEFKKLRHQNSNHLKVLINHTHKLELTGVHPAFGVVKARELISTWVVHDLTHIAQIIRVMSKRYENDVGPWKQYLSVLKI